MTAHPDRDMPPVPIDEMEVIMVDQRRTFGAIEHHLAFRIRIRLPDPRRGAGDEHGKDSDKGGILGLKLFRLVVLGLVADRQNQSRARRSFRPRIVPAG